MIGRFLSNTVAKQLPVNCDMSAKNASVSGPRNWALKNTHQTHIEGTCTSPQKKTFGGVVNKAQPQPTTAKGLFRTRPRPGFVVVGQH